MGFRAEIIASDGADGIVYIYARVDADSEAEAEPAAEAILNGFAKGKLAYIRELPWSKSDLDFDTKVMRHCGGVRFAFKNEPGEWRFPDRSLENAQFIGLPQQSRPSAA